MTTKILFYKFKKKYIFFQEIFTYINIHIVSAQKHVTVENFGEREKDRLFQFTYLYSI